MQSYWHPRRQFPPQLTPVLSSSASVSVNEVSYYLGTNVPQSAIALLFFITFYKSQTRLLLSHYSATKVRYYRQLPYHLFAHNYSLKWLSHVSLNLCTNISIILIASRDDNGGWYDYLLRQKCTIERDDLWHEWGDLKCLQKPTNQMEIDGGLFPDTV